MSTLTIVSPDVAETAERVGRLFTALSDPTRVRLLNLLAAGELCVCDLVEVLDQPQPTVSRHLIRLRRLGLVSVRRRGRFAYYRLATDDPGLRSDVLRLVQNRFDSVPELAAERQVGRERAAARALEPCPE